MIGRYILPWFGGGPAVWTSCLLFFQACLLAGYAYAHWLGSLRNVRLQAGIHVGLLLASLAFLPLHPNAAFWKPVSSADPSGRILLLVNGDSRRPVPVVVRNDATGAAMADDWKSRKIALAIVCSFEFWIVSCVAELSVRLRAVAAAAHAGLHLVRALPGVRVTVRIRSVADAVCPILGRTGESRTPSPRRAPPSGPYCSGSGLSRSADRRCWSRLPIRFRKTSPSVRFCGWQRSQFTC